MKKKTRKGKDQKAMKEMMQKLTEAMADPSLLTPEARQMLFPDGSPIRVVWGKDTLDAIKS